MSDASLPHCKLCGEPDYACVCLETEEAVEEGNHELLKRWYERAQSLQCDSDEWRKRFIKLTEWIGGDALDKFLDDNPEANKWFWEQ